MDDKLLKRIRRFQTDFFPEYQARFKHLVEQGQHPTILFVGALVPPYNGSGGGLHGTVDGLNLPTLAQSLRLACCPWVSLGLNGLFTLVPHITNFGREKFTIGASVDS